MLDQSADERVLHDDTFPQVVSGSVSPEVSAWLKRKQRNHARSRWTTTGAWSLSLLTCGALVGAAIAIVLNFAPERNAANALQPDTQAVSFNATEPAPLFK